MTHVIPACGPEITSWDADVDSDILRENNFQEIMAAMTLLVRAIKRCTLTAHISMPTWEDILLGSHPASLERLPNTPVFKHHPQRLQYMLEVYQAACGTC